MNSNVLEIKGKRIGGDKPQICMPIVARNYDELMIEVGVMLAHRPDLIEWRADYYNDVTDINKFLEVLDKLSNKIKDYPLIFTLRIDQEGGQKKLDQDYRVNLLKEVIKTKKIDIIDFELCNDESKIKEIIELAKEFGVSVIISNHDFQKTPPREDIISRLNSAQQMGADIFKIAVMANSTEDLLELLNATLIMKEKYAKVPIVTMSMSQKGLLSRLAGGIFGSSITFAAGRDVSAPGQISSYDLRNVIDIINKNTN